MGGLISSKYGIPCHIAVKLGNAFGLERGNDSFSGTVVRVMNNVGMGQTDDPDPFSCNLELSVKAAGKITVRTSYLMVKKYFELKLFSCLVFKTV